MARLLMVPVVVASLLVGAGLGTVFSGTGRAAQEYSPGPELEALNDRMLRLENKALPERVYFSSSADPLWGYRLDQTQLFSLLCESYEVGTDGGTFVLNCNQAVFTP